MNKLINKIKIFKTSDILSLIIIIIIIIIIICKKL